MSYNPVSGGGGSPGGSSGQVQYNNGGAFAGATNVSIASNNLALAAISDPSAPASGVISYSKTVAGRTVPAIRSPLGTADPLQAAIWQKNFVMWRNTGATAGLWIGTVGAGAGGFAVMAPGDTNIYTSLRRSRYSNAATTTDQVLGQRNTEQLFFRGSSVAGAGGFFFAARCGFDTWTNGGRFFAGMHSATTVVSADPSALNDTVGFCVDAADNGAISFLTRGTSATKDPTGITIVSSRGYDLFIYCAPGSSSYSWRIVDLVNGTEASGTATLNLPTNTTKLTAGVLASNAALTTANAIQLGVNRIYVETDF